MLNGGAFSRPGSRRHRPVEFSHTSWAEIDRREDENEARAARARELMAKHGQRSWRVVNRKDI